MNIRSLYVIILLPFLLLSCSDKDDEYDRKKAVSVFAIADPIKIDPALKKVKIKLPRQEKNNAWNGTINDQNQRVENFEKKFATKKQFWTGKTQIKLKKTAQIWHSFSFTRDDDFVFSPIIGGENLFVLNTSGVLSAYNLEKEKRLWKKRIFPRKILKNYRTPKISYHDGKIFAIAGVNKVVGVKASNGKLLWSRTISSIPVSTPVSDGKNVFVTTNDNKIYALDIEDGELQWVSSAIMRNTAIFGAADPIFYKNSIIAAFSSGEIYSLDKKTGEILWSQDLNISKANSSDFYLNDIDATPIIKKDIIYSIGNGGLMMAIKAKDGDYLWKREIAGITDFWLAGNFLYVINNDNKLLAIHRKTGGVKWISQLPHLRNEKKPQTKIIYDGIVMAGNKLIISNTEGELLLVSPFNGKVEQKFETGERTYHAPIIVDGKIYLHRLGMFTIDLLEIS